MLSKQSAWEFSAYHFMPAFLHAREHCLDSQRFEDVPPQVRMEHASMVGLGYERMEEFLNKTELEVRELLSGDVLSEQRRQC